MHGGYAIGAGGIAVGELCLSYLVMETMGKKLTKIDFPKGFCVQFTTSSLVICGTLLKLPLSTTHCTVGAVFGLIFASKMSCVKKIYPPEPTEDENIDDESEEAERSKKGGQGTHNS